MEHRKYLSEIAKRRWAGMSADARSAAVASAVAARKAAEAADPDGFRERQRAKARLPRRKRIKPG